ncbi:Anaphase-promoting complex subunit 5 [Nymphaea thermarum]|nr:Anaphase-promoting complex subunit 5 [Nymphaea thermarum]
MFIIFISIFFFIFIVKNLKILTNIFTTSRLSFINKSFSFSFKIELAIELTLVAAKCTSLPTPDAFTALSLVEKRFPPLSHFHIQLLRLQLLHEHFIHRGCIKRAQQVCDELGVLVSSASGVDMDLKAEVNLRHARTLLAAKQFDQAASVAHSLFCMCYEFNMQIKVASALLLMAEIHKVSSWFFCQFNYFLSPSTDIFSMFLQKAENACTGLPYALASLTYCQSFNLDLLGASATLTLADLWLCLGSVHAKRALSLLHQALPMILGHGGLELHARANISIAKCYLADSTFSVGFFQHLLRAISSIIVSSINVPYIVNVYCSDSNLVINVLCT